MDASTLFSLLPDEKIGPLPWGLEDVWGVYNDRPPKFVYIGIRPLVMTWLFIYLVQVLWSSFCLGTLSFTTIPRVAITLGCLYRHIDPWYIMIPRLVTCTFLHYNLMHLAMNAIGFVGAVLSFERGAGMHATDAHWSWYFIFPIWFSGGVAGSLMSYTAKLGRAGSFTVGASGGCYSISVWSTLVNLHWLQSSRPEYRSSLLQNLVIQLIQALPLARAADGKQTDYTAHLGGALVGIIWTCILTYLRQEWDDASRRRLGIILTYLFAFSTIVAFGEVARQAFSGNADRVAKAYFRWLNLYDIKLKKVDPGRRWTIEEMQNIEEKLNINARPPRRPPTDAEEFERDVFSRFNKDVAISVRDYAARATVA